MEGGIRMKIAVIHASSVKDKNSILFECVTKAAESHGHEVINLGVYPEENVSVSYVQTAFLISLLLESKAVDFVVTGCSSGQGMMLACNSLPGVLCGYTATPVDAYLFGRINDGNAVSYPLGLNFGWAGEINLQSTMNSLFSEPFGIGYPAEDALRKQKDTQILKGINTVTKKTMLEILPSLDHEFVSSSLQKRENVYDFILSHGTNEKLIQLLSTFRVC